MFNEDNQANLVYHHDPMSGCPNSTQNITINDVAHGIAFINERGPKYSSSCLGDNLTFTGIDICEINVFGTVFINHLYQRIFEHFSKFIFS